MRFKLDENIGASGAAAIRLAKHDVETVVSQELVGCEDDRLIDVCRNENRCLVTLDKEFGNPLIYPPRNYAGIVLLRLPQRNGKIEMLAAIDGLMNAVAELETSETLQGRLWIAQPDRVREYRARSEDDSED